MINMPRYLGTPEYNLVCENLKTIARQRGNPTGYKLVFKIMKLTPGNYAANQAGYILGEISEQMHLAGKPMLSALIINQDLGTPGKGFFELATLLGKLPAGANDREKIAFWKKELADIYTTEW